MAVEEVRITDLPEATTLSGNEDLLGVQLGETKRFKSSLLKVLESLINDSVKIFNNASLSCFSWSDNLASSV